MILLVVEMSLMFIRIEKKIDGIVDARDETARGDLRVAIDLKKDANSELILNYLLKNTEMQVSYSFIFPLFFYESKIAFIALFERAFTHKAYARKAAEAIGVALAEGMYKLFTAAQSAVSAIGTVEDIKLHRILCGIIVHLTKPVFLSEHIFCHRRKYPQKRSFHKGQGGHISEHLPHSYSLIVNRFVNEPHGFICAQLL